MKVCRVLARIVAVAALAPALELAAANGATYVSQSVPSQLVASTTYAVTVTMKNAGTTTWSEASHHRLGSQNPQDGQTWGLGRVTLAGGETVAAGAQKSFTFNITAPSVAGTYNFQWRMVQDGVEWFGDYTPNVAIAVVPAAPTGLSATFVASSTSETLSWSASAGAATYSVRAKDDTDPNVRDPNNNCPAPVTFYSCIDGLTTTSRTLSVVNGHTYEWWVHGVGVNGAFSTFNSSTFTIVPLPPTNTYPADKAVLPSSTTALNLTWTAATGSTFFAVRLRDDTDGTARDSRNTCSGNPIYVCIDNVATNSLTVTVTPGHSYTYWVHDGNAGGYSTYNQTTFSVQAKDVTPPTVSLTSPANGATVNGSITVAASASDNFGVTRVDLSADGAVKSSSSTPPYQFTWDTAALANGTHTLSAAAYDAAGNSSTSTISVNVSNTTACQAPQGGSLYDSARLNQLLAAGGAGYVLQLCPGALYLLDNTVTYTAANQEIRTAGPVTTSPARLKISVDPGCFMAIDALNVASASLVNVDVDGNIGTRVQCGQPPLDLQPRIPLLRFGGDVSGQVVDHVRAHDTRGWTALQVQAGAGAPAAGCSGISITSNIIGPSGKGFPLIDQWADGISLACRNAVVSGNTVQDASDGAIVVFGAPGSQITGNTIRQSSQVLFGAINVVDYCPYKGDSTGLVVSGNHIYADNAQIQVAVGMGTRAWSACPDTDDCTPPPPGGPSHWPGVSGLHGAEISSNDLHGDYMGYGFAISGVTGPWTVTGNMTDARHTGRANDTNCSSSPKPDAIPFGVDTSATTGATLQPDFVPAATNRIVTWIGPSTPLNLQPNGSVLPGGTTSATLTWSGSNGTSRFLMTATEDGVPLGPLADVPGTARSYTLPVRAGHSYTWSVAGVYDKSKGGTVPGYAASASFTVAVSTPNNPPTAVLSATPTSGASPLSVTLSGTASSDPDAGDSVVSYTFTFGDGSAPVTSSQSSVSHSYSTPGTYTASLSVTDAHGASSTNSATAVVSVLTDGATFVIQSVPSNMTHGAQYSVSVTMKNTGTTTWSATPVVYALQSQNPQGNNTWGLSKVSLTGPVAPQASKQFTFNVTAPSTTGTYSFKWQMVKGCCTTFGGMSQNVTVTVN